jgi:alpha,alpha-trehalase
MSCFKGTTEEGWQDASIRSPHWGEDTGCRPPYDSGMSVDQVTIAVGSGQFPPIAEYGFLSDCETNCLVAPDGSVEWMCLPRPDSPSVFGAILDRTAGMFRFGPTNTHVPHQRRYLPGTMVLETTWHTATGWLIVHDLLLVRSRRSEERRPEYRRAPSDTVATGTLLRVAECVKGRVEVVVNAAPSFEYGAASGVWEYDGDDYGRLTVHPPAGDPGLTVTSSASPH